MALYTPLVMWLDPSDYHMYLPGASKLDIDDYGSIIPLKELELKILANDNTIIQIFQKFFLCCYFY
jgi:hypothetical protein